MVKKKKIANHPFFRILNIVCCMWEGRKFCVCVFFYYSYISLFFFLRAFFFVFLYWNGVLVFVWFGLLLLLLILQIGCTSCMNEWMNEWNVYLPNGPHYSVFIIIASIASRSIWVWCYNMCMCSIFFRFSVVVVF